MKLLLSLLADLMRLCVFFCFAILAVLYVVLTLSAVILAAIIVMPLAGLIGRDKQKSTKKQKRALSSRRKLVRISKPESAP